jgi:hypothetical protein
MGYVPNPGKSAGGSNPTKHDKYQYTQLYCSSVSHVIQVIFESVELSILLPQL